MSISKSESSTPDNWRISSALWTTKTRFKSPSETSSTLTNTTTASYSTAYSESSAGYDSCVEAEECISPLATSSFIKSDANDTAFGTAIDNHLAELWGHNDRGGTRNSRDILAYFESLGEEGRTALATRLVQDAFRLGRMSDTELIAQGLSLACERGLLFANQVLPVYVKWIVSIPPLRSAYYLPSLLLDSQTFSKILKISCWMSRKDLFTLKNY